MIVRPAVRQDAAGIYDIETESFSVPWSRESIDHELEHTELTRYYVLVRDDGYIAGYAGLWRVTDEGQITNIALRKDVQGKGYGELLVRVMIEKAFEEGCMDIFLEVRVSNIPALGLYRKLGFEVLSVRKSYYSEPVEDAYVMGCQKEKYKWAVK
ncbi:MAG: ribosomal protein S18-alanine N-acetyltransferase [Caecibacter massiliensis]|nr:ribosomal protein S18-alanine N-acetyltransferase [Caecibacter massiliensis]